MHREVSTPSTGANPRLLGRQPIVSGLGAVSSRVATAAIPIAPAAVVPAVKRMPGRCPIRCTLLALLVVSPAAAGEIGGVAEEPSHADPAESLTKVQRVRIAAGEVVVFPPRGGEPAVGAAVWVRRAPGAVWRVMVDCDRAPEFVPRMRSCRVLEDHGDVALLEHRVRPTPLLPEQTYVLRVDRRPYERIRFRRVAGALREMTGAWRLRPHRDGTLVSYTVVLDPGFAVPQWAVRRALERDLPELLHALKERVEGPALRCQPSR